MTAHRVLPLIWCLFAMVGGCKKEPDLASGQLHSLARIGDVGCMGEIIGRGADVNARDQRGNTPLHEAISAAKEDAAKLLIAKYADINAQNDRGETPIHVAIAKQERSLVQLLLDSGGNPNLTDKLGQSPVFLAMALGLNEIARDLVAAGARVTIHVAAYLGDLERTEALLDTGAAVNERDQDGATPLHWAVLARRTSIVALLLRHGADPNAKGRRDMTPLHEAAKNGQEDMVETLLAAGANLDSKTADGDTALHFAVRAVRVGVVESLLNKGADPNTIGSLGCTPLAQVLQSALDYPSEKESERIHCQVIAQSLLARGAEVNQEAGGSDLLLQFAIRFGFTDVAKKALVRGDVRINDAAGRSYPFIPLLGAVNHGREDIVELLVANGADVNVRAPDSGDTPLHLVAEHNGQKLAALFLTHGANITAQNLAGRTPLHEAVRAGCTEMAEFLLARGADVNALDRNGDAPLHYAARGDKELSELLLADGAQANTANNQGQTALHVAALRGNTDIVERLLVHGADSGLRDKLSHTALDKATRSGHKATIEVLRKHRKPATDPNGTGPGSSKSGN